MGIDVNSAVSLEASNAAGKYVRHYAGVVRIDPVPKTLDREDATFVVRRLPGQGDSIAFESVNYPRNFVHRQSDGQPVRLDPQPDPRDASFIAVPGLAGNGTASFQWVGNRDTYLRHRDGEIWIESKGADPGFDADASFNVDNPVIPVLVAPPNITMPADGGPTTCWPCFPAGYGAAATGGYKPGATVYQVRSEGDDGDEEGTLRYGVEKMSRPLFICFRPSVQDIYLSKALNLAKGGHSQDRGLTIDGSCFNDQTGAVVGPGVTLHGYSVRMDGMSDVVLRHLRIWPGSLARSDGNVDPFPSNGAAAQSRTQDAVTVRNSDRILLDHLAMAWSNDDLVDITKCCLDVTLQWCLLSHPLRWGGHIEGSADDRQAAHPFTTLISDARRVTMHHNIIAHPEKRTPQLSSGVDVEFVCNVIHDPGSKQVGRLKDGAVLSYYGNLLSQGLSVPDDFNAAVDLLALEGKPKLYFGDNSYAAYSSDGQRQEPQPIALDEAKYEDVLHGGDPPFSSGVGCDPPASEIAKYVGVQARYAYGRHPSAVHPYDKLVLDEVQAGDLDATGRVIDRPVEVGQKTAVDVAGATKLVGDGWTQQVTVEASGTAVTIVDLDGKMLTGNAAGTAGWEDPATSEDEFHRWWVLPELRWVKSGDGGEFNHVVSGAAAYSVQNVGVSNTSGQPYVLAIDENDVVLQVKTFSQQDKKKGDKEEPAEEDAQLPQAQIFTFG